MRKLGLIIDFFKEILDFSVKWEDIVSLQNK